MKRIVKSLEIFIMVMFIFLISYLLIMAYNKHQYYEKKLLDKTNLVVSIGGAPRGRILDKNGHVLVDNVAINNIVFHYVKGIDIKKVSKMLAQIFPSSEVSIPELLNYYEAFYDVGDLLTVEEKQKIKERKLSKDKREDLLLQRITEIEDEFSEEELSLAHMYNLLTKGYLYEDKVIVKEATDEEINMILSKNIPGISIVTSYKRYYPYGNTLKDIFGTVGKISKELKKEYLDRDYSLDEEVGISYLEKEYEKYLKGTKAKFLVNDDYSLTKIADEVKGNDLYLSIDIELQKKLEEIVEKDLTDAKKMPNTEYLNDSYVIVSDPNTSAILAIVGKRYIKDNMFNDINVNTISSSFTMGSVVKGATISVGYKYDLINPYQMVYDGCIKLYSQNQKCSHTNLGYLNAITALKQSSNYYQFLIAIKLAGQNYTPNMKFEVTEKEFNIYREMLASYGLGGKTGIDLPNEQEGMLGSKITGDLLLNLSIGQYDTYTPMQLMTYINTIASNGIKRSPSLVSVIKDVNDNIIWQNEYSKVSEVDIKKEDIALIQEGFHEVMMTGTGSGFMNHAYNSAGKTGTSESFLDTDNDGVIDTSTLTLTMANYFPYDNPKYSFVIVAPSASHNNSSHDYIHYITARISWDLSDYINGKAR